MISSRIQQNSTSLSAPKYSTRSAATPQNEAGALHAQDTVSFSSAALTLGGGSWNEEDSSTHFSTGFQLDTQKQSLETFLDAGASFTRQKGQSRAVSGHFGPVSFNQRAQADAGVEGEAYLFSQNRIDLSRGELDMENRAGASLRANAGAQLENGFELFGHKVDQKNRIDATAAAKAELYQSLHADATGFESKTGHNAEALVEARLSSQTAYTTPGGNKFASRSDVFAQAGAKSKSDLTLVSRPDEAIIGAGFDNSAGAIIGFEQQLSAETNNGSLFDIKGSYGIGPTAGGGLGGLLGRRPGETEIGLNASGKFLFSAGLDVHAKVKDRDVAETATAPLQTGADALTGAGRAFDTLGTGSDVLGAGLNGTQHLLDNTRTGSTMIDPALMAASQLNRGLQATNDAVGGVADRTAPVLKMGGQVMQSYTDRQTDAVEKVVNDVMQEKVAQFNQVYQVAHKPVGDALRTGRQAGEVILNQAERTSPTVAVLADTARGVRNTTEALVDVAAPVVAEQVDRASTLTRVGSQVVKHQAKNFVETQKTGIRAAGEGFKIFVRSFF